ncbi:glycosyltransferase domain-containing protein [Yersinia kristensenii]|uniref:glycosyltransferase domain-containing protein n=1 Tax=Yersinia kristensenii TaxID=28152 RepID=UPI0005E08DAC|nr:glycosyltransferase domain-containing protein [Yersinia kristensenii]CFR04467.1 Protein of uncharacterised function (DUF616) [Yersinia kristensenii]
MSLKKRVVYTAIFGGYDTLHEPKGLNEDIDFVCFTDDPTLRSQKWRVVLVSDKTLNNSMRNRRYKFFPNIYLNDYDESLYIDGNISICSDSIANLFEKYLTENKIAIPFHSERNCIYKEAKKCIEVSKGDPIKINSQIEFYKKVGFPSNYGLYENNVILRKHNDSVIISLMEAWFQQLAEFSARDQLSLCFLMWKYKIKCGSILEGPRFSNKYLKIGFHRTEENLPILNKVILYIYLNRRRNGVYLCTSKLIEYGKRLREKL